MNSQLDNKNEETGQRLSKWGTTRRAVLAAGGAAALVPLAGCSALDGLVERGAGQLVGTTVSAPAAFYAGQAPPDHQDADSDGDGLSDGDEPQFFTGGDTDVRAVPATVRAEGRTIDLEGWSTTTTTRAQNHSSSRSNRTRGVWWAGPDDDGDDDGDGYGDTIVAIQDVELDLLAEAAAAASSISKRSARTGRMIAAIDDSNQDVRATAERCSEDVCKTVRENADDRERLVGQAREHIDNEEWDQAAAAVDEIRDITEGHIERLDDELADLRPERPRFSDLIAYLGDEPTIGERFTVCLPDAKLPGDRGSLAEELTLDRVLAYFAASYEPDGVRAPFNDRYDICCFDYNNDGCIQLDGPVSLHEDLACQNIISAKLDTHTTQNRAIVGFGTEGGAVVSAAPASSDPIGKRVFLAKSDVTGEIILGEDRDMVMPGNDDTRSGSQTLVCPVTVTPEDSPTPLPGLFYVRRVIHDDQIIFAGGWMLDEGALYENSVTLLFDEGPTEVASVTLEDIESDNLEDRIVGQFSRGRSQHGSAVISGEFDEDAGDLPPKDKLPEEIKPEPFQTDQGRKGLNAVNVKVLGEQGDGGDGDDGSDNPTQTTAAALDAPLVHLTDTTGMSNDVKFKAGAELSKAVN